MIPIDRARTGVKAPQKRPTELRRPFPVPVKFVEEGGLDVLGLMKIAEADRVWLCLAKPVLIGGHHG